jgi:hypothetical protein
MAGPYTPGNLELLNQKFNAEIKNIVMKKTVLRPMVTVDTSNVGIETFYSESTTELVGQSDIPRESEFYADQVNAVTQPNPRHITSSTGEVRYRKPHFMGRPACRIHEPAD